MGLGYLTLDRPAPSLSGGEGQRIRLASQIGSELTGVIYVLDEPSIGLHQRDNRKLLARAPAPARHRQHRGGGGARPRGHGGGGLAGGLRPRRGPRTAARSWPRARRREVMVEPDEPDRRATCAATCEIEMPAERRRGDGRKITVVGARENNLKDVTVEFPLGPVRLRDRRQRRGQEHARQPDPLPGGGARPARQRRAGGRAREGRWAWSEIDKVIDIDQSPIGRTPRSNPATYTKLFDLIRDFFALLPEARMHGYTPGRFSFNVKGGRCEACEGDGVKRVEMHFLADVYVPCEVCHGKRFNEATLQVKYNGLSIADVLDLTVDEALAALQEPPADPPRAGDAGRRGPGLHRAGPVLAHPVRRRGPARQALARAVASAPPAARSTSWTSPPPACTSRTSASCWRVLDRLVEGGNTVVVIEHNLDVIKTADHVIDIGPGGGDAGGRDRGHGHAGGGGGGAGVVHRPLPGRPAAQGRRPAPRGALEIGRPGALCASAQSRRPYDIGSRDPPHMGALTPRWVVVDELVHELGSLRAVAQQVESRTLAHDLAGELRLSLARAADTVHLVIGGDEAMIAQAWRTIADAREVSARALTAAAGSRAIHRQAATLRERVKAEVRRLERYGRDLQALREAGETRRTSAQDVRQKD